MVDHVDGVFQTHLRLLHDFLAQGPTEPAHERGRQAHGEPHGGEARGLVGEEADAHADAHHN